MSHIGKGTSAEAGCLTRAGVPNLILKNMRCCKTHHNPKGLRSPEVRSQRLNAPVGHLNKVHTMSIKSSANIKVESRKACGVLFKDMMYQPVPKGIKKHHARPQHITLPVHPFHGS